MKDTGNMLEFFIKEDHSDEIVPMTKLTRGLLHVYHISKAPNDITFNHIDEYATGLSINDLKLCLEWRTHYFKMYNTSSEATLWDGCLSEEEKYERSQQHLNAVENLKRIESVLGKPQGRFAI